MRRLSYIITLATLLNVAVAPRSFAQKKVNAPKGKEYVFDKSLGKRGVMEIYFPDDHDPGKPVPGIILFHGGAWVSGNLQDFRYQAHYFASRGLVAATSHYELAPRTAEELKGRTKREVTNVSGRKAIRWFRANAKELGIDPERIIAGGGSAGGQTALGATLNHTLDGPDTDKSVDTSVAAYVLFNPANSLGKEGLEAHLKPADMPPAIAFFGTSDPYLLGYEAWQEAMVTTGAPQMQILYAPWKPHAFFKIQPWADACLIEADRFLARLGYLRGKPTLPEPGAKFQKTRDIELPDEVLQRKVVIDRKTAHTREWLKRTKPKAAENAPEITVAEALERGYLLGPSCAPSK